MQKPRARVFKQARWVAPTKEECVASRLVYGALNICATDCFSLFRSAAAAFLLARRGLTMFSRVETKKVLRFFGVSGRFVAAAVARLLSPEIKCVHDLFNWTSCVTARLQELRLVSANGSGMLILIAIIRKRDVFGRCHLRI